MIISQLYYKLALELYLKLVLITKFFFNASANSSIINFRSKILSLVIRYPPKNKVIIEIKDEYKKTVIAAYPWPPYPKSYIAP